MNETDPQPVLNYASPQTPPPEVPPLWARILNWAAWLVIALFLIGAAILVIDILAAKNLSRGPQVVPRQSSP